MYRVEEMKNVSFGEEEEEEEDLERVKREVESKCVKREDRGRRRRQSNREWRRERLSVCLKDDLNGERRLRD